VRIVCREKRNKGGKNKGRKEKRDRNKNRRV
jgi:hypothetical protein